ncbi:hypothetical protein CBR_g50173 [Chara braunii]|uniref:Cysteine protease n=1 Tax=Chara braunii TaxID=69332 RepID=A0A388M6B5_CHABU|nr:hypothetical protein CBR_g50173 [Chara braunii]|eukprot:GBG90080.1 hypothetical protein CBR_g50173 [Chara braunii]
MDAIDPSLALGFYCRDRDDFMDLHRQLAVLAEGSGGAPLLTVGKRVSKPVTPVERPVSLAAGNDDEWTLL